MEDLKHKDHLLVAGFEGEFDPQESFQLSSGPNRIGRLGAGFARYINGLERQVISRPRRIVGVSQIVILPNRFKLSPIDLFDVYEIFNNGVYRPKISKTQYNLFCVGEDEFVSFAWINGLGWQVDLIKYLSRVGARVAMTFNGSLVFHSLYGSC